MAAKNMYGIPTPYEDTYAMKNTMNFFGLPALCIGDINRLDSHTLVITEEDSKNYRKALVEDGVLKSILMVGNISGSGIYQYLIKNQIKLPSATGASSGCHLPTSMDLTRQRGPIHGTRTCAAVKFHSRYHKTPGRYIFRGNFTVWAQYQFRYIIL